MISRNTFGICAGVAGALFIGYCVYFDKKRRSDPNFKRKLREKRNNARKPSRKFPNMADPVALQQYFITEMTAGEKLLSEGDVAGGIEKMAIAVTVCSQPDHLLQILQQTLPPQVFSLLMQALPIVGARLKAEAEKQKKEKQKVLKISEEDPE